MTNQELLDLIGDARGVYILQAQEYREEKAEPRRTGLRRPLLVAAIIALTLMLVGCAVVYVLSVKNMKIGQYTRVEESHYGPYWEVIEEKQITYDVISLQGFTDSPNQRATRQWHDYLDSYPEYILDVSPEIRHAIPDNYYAYGCYTWEMTEQLDKIAEGHGLKLLGEYVYINRGHEQVLFDALEISGICREQEYAQVEYAEGHLYPEGTFDLGVNITLDDSFDWIYLVMADFRYSRKGYFDDFTVAVTNLEEYREWEYTMPGGETALLALGEEKALILWDQGDAFLSVVFDSRMGIDRMTAEMVEKIADLFDFSVTARSISWEAEKAAREKIERVRQELKRLEEKDLEEYNAMIAEYEAAEHKEDFDGWVRQTLETSYDRGVDLGYAFYDIDGDGTEELLIGRDGYGTALYMEKDGTIQQFANASVYLYPCEGNKIVYAIGMGDQFSLTKWENGQSRGEYRLGYIPGDPAGDYRNYDLDKFNEYSYISETEFREILHSYVRIPVKFLPLSEYPLTQGPDQTNAHTGLLQEPFTSYEEKIRVRLTDQEERWVRWSYDLEDLNGDGQPELIWREDDRYFLYTLHDGQVSCFLFTGDRLTVCENGLVEAVSCYGTDNRTYRYYRVGRERLELVEYLRYDVDADPENPWKRSSDRTGQDVTLESITASEAKAIQAKYVPMLLDMKPIAEYPMG